MIPRRRFLAFFSGLPLLSFLDPKRKPAVLVKAAATPPPDKEEWDRVMRSISDRLRRMQEMLKELESKQKVMRKKLPSPLPKPPKLETR